MLVACAGCCWMHLETNYKKKRGGGRNELREELASLQAGMKDSRDHEEIQRFVELEEATISQSQLIKYTIKKCFQQ